MNWQPLRCWLQEKDCKDCLLIQQAAELRKEEAAPAMMRVTVQ